MLNNPFEEQRAFQLALKEYIGSIDPVYAKETEEFFVAFEGSFGNKHVTPRTLLSKFLGNLVCVEGIATKCKFAYYLNIYIIIQLKKLSSPSNYILLIFFPP